MSPNLDILLIEDNEADAWLFSDLLREYEPESELHLVSDGVEASDYLLQRDEYKTAHRPDVVILDLNLPRKDGRQLLREMKANPSLRDIPVIVVTGGGAKDDKERSLEMGAVAYHNKPVNLDDYQVLMEELTKKEFPQVLQVRSSA